MRGTGQGRCGVGLDTSMDGAYLSVNSQESWQITTGSGVSKVYYVARRDERRETKEPVSQGTTQPPREIKAKEGGGSSLGSPVPAVAIGSPLSSEDPHAKTLTQIPRSHWPTRKARKSQLVFPGWG